MVTDWSIIIAINGCFAVRMHFDIISNYDIMTLLALLALLITYHTVIYVETIAI